MEAFWDFMKRVMLWFPPQQLLQTHSPARGCFPRGQLADRQHDSFNAGVLSKIFHRARLSASRGVCVSVQKLAYAVWSKGLQRSNIVNELSARKSFACTAEGNVFINEIGISLNPKRTNARSDENP